MSCGIVAASAVSVRLESAWRARPPCTCTWICPCPAQPSQSILILILIVKKTSVCLLNHSILARSFAIATGSGGANSMLTCNYKAGTARTSQSKSMMTTRNDDDSLPSREFRTLLGRWQAGRQASVSGSRVWVSIRLGVRNPHIPTYPHHTYRAVPPRCRGHVSVSLSRIAALMTGLPPLSIAKTKNPRGHRPSSGAGDWVGVNVRSVSARSFVRSLATKTTLWMHT